jgi:hypothetical protein
LIAFELLVMDLRHTVVGSCVVIVRLHSHRSGNDRSCRLARPSLIFTCQSDLRTHDCKGRLSLKTGFESTRMLLHTLAMFNKQMHNHSIDRTSQRRTVATVRPSRETNHRVDRELAIGVEMRTRQCAPVSTLPEARQLINKRRRETTTIQGTITSINRSSTRSEDKHIFSPRRTLYTALITLRSHEHCLLLSSQSRCPMINQKEDKRHSESEEENNQQMRTVCRNMDSAVRKAARFPHHHVLS